MLSSHLAALGWFLRGRRQRHGHPACGRRRYPLIVSVREVALEVRLDRDSSALHMPGPVFELRVQQKADSTLVSRVRNRQSAAFMQRNQGLPGRVRVAGERWKLRPSAICALLVNQTASGFTD